MSKNKLRGLAPLKAGFTLIEILVVIGIIAVLAAVVIIAINPARQFKLARDSQRTANVSAILNAIGQNISEHRGLFTCSGAVTALPSTTPQVLASASGFAIAPCLVPDYLPALPFDPSASGAGYTSTSSYNTGYEIVQDVNGRLTVSAPGTELASPAISLTR